MKSRPFDPLHLDVEAFACAAGKLDGSWSLAALPRLMQGASTGADVTWSAQGRTLRRTGAPAQIWVDVQARATVTLQCQRCLGPVATPLELARSFRFMPDERQAAELDADSDDEVLVLSRNFDLRELIEDELILALPLVPRHEACPAPLALRTEPAPLEEEKPEKRENPFAALAALKRGRNT